MRILVVSPSWVGDSVLVQPLLMRLRERHPRLVLDVFAPAWVADIFRQMPEVDEVVDNPFQHGDLRVRERRRIGASLRQRGYDQAIVLPNSAKAALVPVFAGIPTRTGFRGEMRYGLLNDVRRLDEKALPLLVERFALLAEAPHALPRRPLPRPALQVTSHRQDHVREKLGLHSAKPVAVFCPGAEYGPAKRWPTHYFADLARLLVAKNYQVWVLGSSNDHVLGESIQYASGSVCLNLCGKTDLSEAMALLAAANVVVTNDSGLMHIAAALDRPLVAIYGSSSPAFTPPLSDHAKVASLNVECSPCFKRECPLGHFKCMLDLPPERVLAELPVTPS